MKLPGRRVVVVISRPRVTPNGVAIIRLQESTTLIDKRGGGGVYVAPARNRFIVH